MTHGKNSLRLCTFNCRSLKIVNEIKQLCATHDAIFLQENWLLRSEALSSIPLVIYLRNFQAMDTSAGIIVGRPFGGTAILYRTRLQTAIKVIDAGCWRICALVVYSDIGPILCCNVYMATDYGNDDCFEDYADVCSKLSALYTGNDIAHFLVPGDFNCANTLHQ